MLLLAAAAPTASGFNHVILTDVPDYAWHAGCFGTASGNLIGFWDRHGLPDLYTGPTAGGVAPLHSAGSFRGIRSMWASEAGQDGRPITQPGHMDDYYVDYESPLPDPYLTAGRPEHTPDCIGDFIGLNQQKWKNLNNECDGNIDAYSFTFWEPTGNRRWNYLPSDSAGAPIPDIPSGLRNFTAWRGYGCDVFSQLADFNPTVTPGRGFRFEDLKSEIDSGYPVLIFMQDGAKLSRAIGPMLKANPIMHGLLAYGYIENDTGEPFVIVRTSWGSGDNQISAWQGGDWTSITQLEVRGLIGFRPLPKIKSIERNGKSIHLTWDGPLSRVQNMVDGSITIPQTYVIEAASTLAPDSFQPVGEPVSALSTTLELPTQHHLFLRVKLLTPNLPTAPAR